MVLYFCVADLSVVDHMYQFSLNWFLKLFVNALTKVDQVEDIESRIKLLNEFVTESVFKQVCGSLFEKHKLLFSFLLSIKILGDAIDLSEWKFLIRGHNPHQVSVKVGDSMGDFKEDSIGDSVAIL